MITLCIIPCGSRKIWDESVWLNQKFYDKDKLSTLLAPYPSGELEAYKVSTFVNSPKNESPKCIEPVDDN